MANDYNDLLNSLPIIKLLHAKWVRGARGHYFGQLALFCVCLVFHALLCQHRRQGLAEVFALGTRQAVLKQAIRSAAMCQSPYLGTSLAPNGSVAVTKASQKLTHISITLTFTAGFFYLPVSLPRPFFLPSLWGGDRVSRSGEGGCPISGT